MDLDILGLSADDSKEPDKIRKAYRAALLRYHPDKGGDHSNRGTKLPGITIQHVKHAYTSLIQKSGGDSENQLQNPLNSRVIVASDVIDLDDMNYDEASNCWWRSCRCGEDQGYLLTEEDLILNGNDTEINVQCIGCSLWVKVQYAVVGGE